MSNDNLLKGLSAAAFAAVGVYFRQLSFPFVLLLCVMVLDYASGMARAWYRGELCSKIGLRGIIKKLCYLFAVAVAVTADFVLQIAAERAAFDLSGCYFCALLVMVWLILNECISILENVSDIGVPVPAFLMGVVVRLKKRTEEKTGDAEEMAEGETEVNRD